MLRKIVVALTILLCSMATQVYALGLGTVTVESALNQPLRMRIELLQLGDTRLQDIRVSMASGEDFERFNIERAGFLSNIRFNVESTPQGNVVILSSSQIVREPYLSFILDTRWPNGRLLSEHTILLDLPVFNDQRSAADIRQPISPILQAPVSSKPADAEPFVDNQTQASVSAPRAANVAAGSRQSEINAPEPQVEPQQAEVETATDDTGRQPEPVVADTAEVAAPAEPEEESAVEAVVQEVAVEDSAEEAIIEQAVAEEPPEEVTVAEPAAVAAAEEPVEPEAIEPEIAEPATYETGGSDTLSDVALRLRPNSTVTMQQTMLALQELNPDAFDKGNINRLRGGEVLRVPSLEEIQSIDPRDALDEVARQNQEFEQLDIQPLAAPSTATPVQDEQPQGQLSVVSSDEAIEPGNGGAQAVDPETAALDQRIAELEAQLAQRREDADRARIEREELDSRMADLEAQIAAAQEIIRLQDIQLAQLREALELAAAEAQLEADRQASQLAAQAAAAQPANDSSSFLDDVLRILTGNIIFMVSAIVLVISLLVVLLLRRNRAAKSEDGEIDEIAAQDFDSDDGLYEAVENDDLEPDDHEPLNSDAELHEIIAPLNDSHSDDEDLIGVEEATQQDFDGVSKAAQPNRESENKSFLDDLGIDLDSFDYEEEAEVAKESGEDETQRDTDQAADPKESAEPEPEEVDLAIDFGTDADDNSPVDADAESIVPEGEAEEIETFEFDLDDDSDALKIETEDGAPDIDTLEFDASAAEEVQADAAVEDDDDIDLETFSFDVDSTSSSEETKSAETDTKADEGVEQEADPNSVEFSFDEDQVGTEVQPEPVESEDLETFDFDLDDDAGDTVLEKAGTQLNPHASTALDLDDDDDFEFDLDGFDFEPVEVDSEASDAEASKSDSDDDFLDLDADAAESLSSADESILDPGAGVSESEEDDDDFLDLDVDLEAESPTSSSTDSAADSDADEIEFDVDSDDEPVVEDAKVSDPASELDDDDLDFLFDDDVEIESVDDFEEIDMLSEDDEAATKLELAYAYQKMGDIEGSKEILQEVVNEGSDEQIAEAKKLLESLNGKPD